MFSSLQRESSSKQLLTFTVSLCLQAAVLLAIVGGCGPQMSGPSLLHQSARSAVTPIYFHRDAPATSVAAEPVPAAAPEVAKKAEPNQEQESTSQAADETASGESNGQGLVPFANWSMNSRPTGFFMFHHQFKTALPVFTPDPPILHAKTPEIARGKDLVLEVVIDDQGSIVQAKVLRGVGNEVEMAIMETLRQWIFVPAKVNGVAIASRQQLRFHFPG